MRRTGEQKIDYRYNSWEEEGEYEDTESDGMLKTYGTVAQETDPACAEKDKHSRFATVFRKKS